jgi:DNA repair photolyase
MSWHNQIWPNFVEYVTTFEPYKKHSENFMQYFGNNKTPSTGFKNRSLSWYNPVSNRFKFNCGYRMNCNVYRSCDHGCSYCYVNGYSGGVTKGKRNSSFVKNLKRDLNDFVHCNMPKGPVHISNSTDPLQERLEKKHYDTFQTLKLLSNYKDYFSEFIILTKNPGMLLGSNPDYMPVIESIKDILSIEISIAFFRNNYQCLEPEAPNPQDRLKALQELIKLGFNVRLRLDPLFPQGNGEQTHDDIVSILDGSKGIQCVISKPLRLIKPKKGQPELFYNMMTEHYQGGKKAGVEWHGGRYVYSRDRVKNEMGFLSDQCLQRNIPLIHCKKTVLVDTAGKSLIKKILEQN